MTGNSSVAVVVIVVDEFVEDGKLAEGVWFAFVVDELCVTPKELVVAVVLTSLVDRDELSGYVSAHPQNNRTKISKRLKNDKLCFTVYNTSIPA